jgi:hypothetical protein
MSEEAGIEPLCWSFFSLLEQSMGAGNRGGIGFRISPPETVFLNFSGARNRFQGIDSASLCSLAGRYDNPIPTWFLAPVDCSKIPAQST